MYCINCNNITIRNLALTNNHRGISFYNTGSSRILNNIILNNFDGIYLESSSGNTLDSNTVNKSVNNGVSLSGSASNTVINNRIAENGVSGIKIIAERAGVSEVVTCSNGRTIGHRECREDGVAVRELDAFLAKVQATVRRRGRP